MTIVGAFLNSELRTGGHVRYLELLEALGRRGHRVIALMNRSLQYSPRSFEAMCTPVSYRRRGFPPASRIFAAHARACSSALQKRIGTTDIVLVFGETHLDAGSVLARRLSSPLVYGHRSNTAREMLTYLSEAHGRPFRRLGLMLRLAKSVHEERRISRLASLVVFQSAFDLDDFRSRVPLSDRGVTVIRGDISNPRFKGEYACVNSSTAARRVIFMGALGRRKGVDYLIDAVALLRSRGCGHLRFEICGPGDRRNQLEKAVAGRGLSEMIRFAGRVPDPFKAIAESDLLVVPSLFDSYPNTVLEALHTGTPVIGSRVGGIPDQLSHDELLFPPMDAEAIADRIERCVREPEFYQRLRELCSGRRAVFTFDWAEAWEKALMAQG